jgi:hypothetical protein
MGGEKGKMLSDPTQYEVELDPAWSYEYMQTKQTGSFTCKGKVTNIGRRPLSLRIRCTLYGDALGKQTREHDLGMLSPGASAKYQEYVGYGQESADSSTMILQGERSIPFYNVYEQRIARGKAK